MQQLTKIKDLTWQEVFSLWRDGEADLPHWIEHYKQRGFNSWDDWRASSVHDLYAEDLVWALYEVKDPLNSVSGFYSGPFRPWIKNYYPDGVLPTFKELVDKNPKIQEGQTIKEMLANFPAETNLVGLKTDQGIVIIEGLHRCSAIALAAQKNIPLQTKVKIAVADFPGEIPVMGQQTSPAA